VGKTKKVDRENHKGQMGEVFAAAGPLAADERLIVDMFMQALRQCQVEFRAKQQGLQQYCAKLIAGRGLKVEEWTVNCDTFTLEPLPEDKRPKRAPAPAQAPPAEDAAS
jgi:hypothetical protein